MAYHFSFADNGVYSATDVNNITKRLVTSGIADSFEDGVPYNLSNMNELGSVIYTSGVVPETISTLKVIKNGDSTITIFPGMAFFADGSVIEIEDGGETLAYTEGAKNYVYLKNDLINSNTSYPVCSTETPIGDYVPLAEISEDGAITDKRTYAKGKLPGYASGVSHLLKIEDSFKEIGTGGTRVYGTKSYDIGNNRFRFLMAFQRDTYSCLGVYDLEKQEYNAFCGNTAGKSEGSQEKLYLYSYTNRSLEATVSVSDGILTLDMTYHDYTSIDRGEVCKAPFTLYLF